MRLVVSTVGTSLMTGYFNRARRTDTPLPIPDRLNELTNRPSLSPEDQVWLGHLTELAQAPLMGGSITEVRAASAELNGIYGLYNDQLVPNKADVHYLVSTDTAIGRCCAELIRQHLTAQGLNASVHVAQGLTTATSREFENGIKHLLTWCENTIPPFRQSYQVVFNLAGGFKSLQGYLQAIGMFYADEIIYLFEGPRSELIRIPRLPLVIDQSLFGRHASVLAMMAEGARVLPVAELSGLPSTLYDADEDGNAVISTWGQLIWQRVRHELLKTDQPLELPRLLYTPIFCKIWRDEQDAKKRENLIVTLAKVATLLEERNGATDGLRGGGLQYDPCTGKGKAQNLYHFRLSQGSRVLCVPRDGGLELRDWGYHNVCP